MTCHRSTREVGPGDFPADHDGLADPDDHDHYALMRIGENSVPIHSEKVMPHWHEPRGDKPERFMCSIVLGAIGAADTTTPTLVTGSFVLPNRGDVFPCWAPDGREFTGRQIAIQHG